MFFNFASHVEPACTPDGLTAQELVERMRLLQVIKDVTTDLSKEGLNERQVQNLRERLRQSTLDLYLHQMTCRERTSQLVAGWMEHLSAKKCLN